MINKKNVWFIFLFIVLSFFLIELKGLNHYSLGDENSYIYMGKLMSEGVIPYRDFFYAHPILHVFIASIIFKLFGFKLFLFKLIPLLSAIIATFFLFKLIKEKYGDIEALFAVLLFLFSNRVLLEATYFLGVNLTTMFVVIGFYYLSAKKRYILSGIFFGFAGITRFYSLIPTIAVLTYFFFKDRKILLRFLLGFSIVFVLANIIFILLFGNDYISSVFIYHLKKPTIEEDTLNIFKEIITKNFLLFLSAILFFFTKVKKKKEALTLLIIAFYLIFLARVRLFNFYFVMLFPFVAILGGIGLGYFIKKFKKKKKNIILTIFLILFFYSLITSLNRLYSFDFVDFQSGDTIFRHITENSNENDEMIGDSSTVPLIALKTNRKIAFNLVDTNAQRILTNSLNLDEVLKRIKEEKVKYVILSPTIGFGNTQKVADFVNNNCFRSLKVVDKYWGDIYVYECSSGTSDKGKKS